MQYLDTVKRIQFEISTVCNSQCIGCARTDSSTLKTKPIIPKNQFLSLDIFEKIFKDNRTKNLTEVQFCGSIDEATCHPNFLDIIKIILNTHEHIRLSIHTNGGTRSTKYWIKLATLLKKFGGHEVRFAFDGLEDTNHIYRHNVSWKKLTSNAQAFIDEGGNATCQTLKFPWNSHQIDNIQNLAIEMGFRRFQLRHDRSVASEMKVEEILKLRKSKKLDLGGYRQAVYDPYDNWIDDSFKDEFINRDNDKVNCLFKKDDMLFINWNAQVWPCCFISNHLLGGYLKQKQLFKETYFLYGKNFNSLKHYTLTEILNTEWFKNKFVASWDNGIRDKENPRLWICSHKCTKNSIPHQEKTSDVISIPRRQHKVLS